MITLESLKSKKSWLSGVGLVAHTVLDGMNVPTWRRLEIEALIEEINAKIVLLDELVFENRAGLHGPDCYLKHLKDSGLELVKPSKVPAKAPNESLNDPLPPSERDKE